MVVERKGFDQQSPKNPNDLGESTRTILHQRAHHVPRRPTRKARLRPLGDASALGRARPAPETSWMDLR